ncbi:hypothetical protein Tco_0317722 [Tanacetum coccineum]
MSMYQKPFMRGILYINFTVEFPEFLSPEQCKALEGVLPPSPLMLMTKMELDELGPPYSRGTGPPKSTRRLWL